MALTTFLEVGAVSEGFYTDEEYGLALQMLRVQVPDAEFSDLTDGDLEEARKALDDLETYHD